MLLLMWHYLSGFHMSSRFVTYVYLKCQLDLNTCHHLISPCFLANVVLPKWGMMMWDLNVCSMCLTSWLWSSDLRVNLHILNPFSTKWLAPKLTKIGPSYPHPMITMHCPDLMALIHLKNLGLWPSGEFICSWFLFARFVRTRVDHLLPLTMVWQFPYFTLRSRISVTLGLWPSSKFICSWILFFRVVNVGVKCILYFTVIYSSGLFISI